MPTSRLMNPVGPGGLLSTYLSTEFTPTEELTLQAIAAGSYFVENEVPSGTINDVNKTFNTANTVNPSYSLEVYKNGSRMKITEDYIFTAPNIIVFVNNVYIGDLLLVNYRRQP